MSKCLPLLCLLSSIIFTSNAQVFTEVGGTLGDLDVGGIKEGGAVWADFDNDGDLDVLINTNVDSRLIRNNVSGFNDVTASLAAGILLNVCPRSAVWGDLNNDGFVDFVRNEYNRIEIYLNRGTIGGGYPDYSFGVDLVGGADEMVPNIVITQLEPGACVFSGGMNAEGVGLIDYNNDGWLDLILESGQCGIDILENRLDEAPVSGSSVINVLFDEGGDSDGVVENASEAISNDYFRHVSTTANSFLGLPETSGNGDYITVGDYDGDGLVDVVVRKPYNPGDPSFVSTNSIWRNDGDGTFTDIGVSLTGVFVNNPTESAPGCKGGVIMCDFDKDGDFDLFWSDAGTNQIWLQDPTGTYTATAKPSIPGTPDIDGCACGDVDLDGDTDLFLGNNSGNSYLFLNGTTIPNDVSALNFSRTDIAVNADAEGVNMIDYNGDGDFDLYVNVNGGANQVWDNDLCDGGGCNFLNILIEDCIDGTIVTRPVVGAAVLLKDTNGNIVTAKVDGSTASGHGAQNPPSPLMAIPDPNEDYIAEITFPEKNGVVEYYEYQFKPSSLIPANTLTLTAVNGTDGSFCSFSILPVELLYFTAENNDEGVLLKWATATELNNDYFVIERSHNGKVFDEIARIKGSGTTQVKVTYSHLDPYPFDGFNYYRLVQYDYDGTATKSKIIRIKSELKRGEGISIYPNPVRDQLTINLSEQWQREGSTVVIHDLQGNKVLEQEIDPFTARVNISWLQTNEGFYWIKISNRQQTVIRKLIRISP